MHTLFLHQPAARALRVSKAAGFGLKNNSEVSDMNAKNFGKGIGVGMAVGAAVSMSITEMNKKNGKQHKFSRALRTMGDMVENIGSSFGM